MSEFFQASKAVTRLVRNWNEKVDATKLEDLIGCKALCVFHYKDDEIFMEMPNGSKPRGCPKVTEGQFLKGILDDRQ